MVFLIPFHLELRLASSGTEFELFKDSTVSSGETSVALSRVPGGSTGGAIHLRGNALVACR
jgi:hypothetical protein